MSTGAEPPASSCGSGGRARVRHLQRRGADGGVSWQPLAVDLTGRSVSLARQSLPGSTDARLRVIASDGLLSTAGTFDRDGSLGSGARLLQRADLLSEGQHVITVTARATPPVGRRR